jgi:hypothetical protein
LKQGLKRDSEGNLVTKTSANLDERGDLAIHAALKAEAIHKVCATVDEVEFLVAIEHAGFDDDTRSLINTRIAQYVNIILDIHPECLYSKDKDGKSAFCLALKRCDPCGDVMRYFLQRDPLLAQTPFVDGRLPIHLAADDMHCMTTHELVKAFPAGASQLDIKGAYPIHSIYGGEAWDTLGKYPSNLIKAFPKGLAHEGGEYNVLPLQIYFPVYSEDRHKPAFLDVMVEGGVAKKNFTELLWDETYFQAYPDQNTTRVHDRDMVTFRYHQFAFFAGPFECFELVELRDHMLLASPKCFDQDEANKNAPLHLL